MNAPTAELTRRPTIGNQYDPWNRRMSGEAVPFHENEPQAGFYRIEADAVAYYWLGPEDADCDPETVRCKVNGERVSHNDARAKWQWASKRLVSHESYKKKLETGNWPSESSVVSDDIAIERTDPNANTFEGLQKRINTLRAAADAVMKAGAAPDKETSDAAADIANRLAHLWKRSDDGRELEKRPHLQASREVDDKWRPLLATATIYKTVKVVVIEPYLKVAKAAKDAAERKAREDADKLKREAEAAQRELEKALTSNGSDELVTAAVQEKVQAAVQAAAKVEQVASQRVTAGTRGGRSIGLRGKTVVTITDREACLAFFKDRQEITDVLQTLAEANIKAGFLVPGVTSSQDSSAA